MNVVSADVLAARTESNRAFFAAVADPLARLCHAMSERFARGGRLIAVGATPAARSDARHVAVEFVHPVIVGKRALPAIALAAEGGDVAAQLELVAEPDDIVMGFGPCSFEVPRARGCLTIAFAPTGAEWGSSPRPRTASSRRSSPRPPTTCCGSSCTCSSSIAEAHTTPAPRASSIRSSRRRRTTWRPWSPTCALRSS